MSPAASTPRQVADAYDDELCELNPIVSTSLGRTPASDGLPDLSPAGLEAEAELQRRTLADLDRVIAGPIPANAPAEQRCARLLRERLTASLDQHAAGEGFRALSNLFSPIHEVRQVFALMSTETVEDWQVFGRRLARVPEAYRGFVARLTERAARGLFVAPRQVHIVVDQLDEWLTGPYFASLVVDGPETLQTELQRSAAAADGAVAELRDFLRDTYAPQAVGTPDAVGRERYARFARFWNGTDLGAGSGLEDAFRWGWGEYRRILAEQQAMLARCCPAPHRWRRCTG